MIWCDVYKRILMQVSHQNILVRYIRGFWCRFLTKIFLEWFDVMFLRNLHQNPLIYLKDITSNHSKNIFVRNLHQNPLIYLTKIFLNKVLPELSIILCALTCWLSNMARVTSVKAWSFTFTIHTKHHVKLFRDVCVLLWYMKTVLYIPYLWQIFSPL